MLNKEKWPIYILGSLFFLDLFNIPTFFHFPVFQINYDLSNILLTLTIAYLSYLFINHRLNIQAINKENVDIILLRNYIYNIDNNFLVLHNSFADENINLDLFFFKVTENSSLLSKSLDIIKSSTIHIPTTKSITSFLVIAEKMNDNFKIMLENNKTEEEYLFTYSHWFHERQDLYPLVELKSHFDEVKQYFDSFE